MTDSAMIPVIRLYGCLIVSIQVDLTDSMVVALKEDIGTAIERSGARGLLIDVSGMFVMDSYVSRAIQELAQIARLMGVEAVIVGMAPAVATTLVEMSVRQTGVKTALNLERGLEVILQKLPQKEPQKEPEVDRP
ncbi:STAS domain-containing protein [Myxococcota bacterium]